MGMHTAVKEKEPQSQRKLSSVLVPVLLVLAGLCVLLYPVVATQWNNIRQVKVAQEYAKYEQTVPEEVINKELEDALYYNDHRGEAAVSDPWSGAQDERSPGFQEYKKQLDAYDAMGRVVLPKANINLPIYHGTSHAVLQKGVGHLYGTDLPVGGVGKHAVMTGHTGLQNATLFDNLSKVVVGDAIYIQSAGQKNEIQGLPDRHRAADRSGQLAACRRPGPHHPHHVHAIRNQLTPVISPCRTRTDGP